MNRLLTRRSVLSASVATATAAALAACSNPSAPAGAATRILPTDPLIADFEARRAAGGAIVTQQLTAAPFNTQITGKSLTTLGYNGSLNGPLIRAKTGDLLDIPVANKLTEGSSVHWHGLALRNDADGVQGLTQEPIAAGADYSYRFRLAHPGTYWYHSHFDMQRERALYGALVIEDPKEALSYDQEWVIILDDWLDGITGTPEEALEELSMGMDMSGGNMEGMDHGDMGGMDMGMKHMLMGATSDYLGGDAGDVKIPVHLFNGKPPQDPEILDSRPGNRVRLRIINAAGDTAYRVGVPGQKITLTHTDGFPVQQQDVDAVVLGMGERIDALLTVRDGYTPVLALPEGKDGNAYGLISTGIGTAPSSNRLPKALDGTVTDGSRLKADESVLFAPKPPDRVHEMRLTGSMEKYDWGINGRRFDMANPLDGAFDLRLDERVQVKIVNDTDMWHPMHLHGHTFQLAGNGARKDTVIVKPKQTVVFEFDADNPGQWLTHCHNSYHAEAGMMGVFSYLK
ncbi:Multicopper oxidase with three cupredoxin domains (includes cell division protein FtsP and spore coat protein CotA) [Arthrobacter subterraneus]|uniref:Multicopper oxidase with three cupredoxin domains (Includes cell division protein FtsP and spore coat protein CotA) n=1 Tax=Arthrobacter subterraneus TaxID=335973 RepID=A0A1G8CQW7_9MICC|nr:multicopper oxidase family protein [Arthrobacter subterraneus]AOY70815.1 copper oxidase [Arthrobacter sp. ZXY-2]SDH47310.1 Multicopper oxidase with three cupredoxin domains (includes cell division protein FtsP and spore coat protein CotA) [Arthrobacter subterraneus]